MGYTIQKKEKITYTAKIMLEHAKKTIQYDFEVVGDGWHIKRYVFDVDTAFPNVSDMYLPQEIVDKILLVESTKNKLVE